MRLVLVFYDWVPKAPEFGTKPNLFFLNEIFLLGLPSLQEHKPYSQNVDGIPMRGPNRPVVKKGKIMISLSSVILFKEARSGFLHFFNLYDKSCPKETNSKIQQIHYKDITNGDVAKTQANLKRWKRKILIR